MVALKLERMAHKHIVWSGKGAEMNEWRLLMNILLNIWTGQYLNISFEHIFEYSFWISILNISFEYSFEYFFYATEPAHPRLGRAGQALDAVDAGHARQAFLPETHLCQILLSWDPWDPSELFPWGPLWVFGYPLDIPFCSRSPFSLFIYQDFSFKMIQMFSNWSI